MGRTNKYSRLLLALLLLVAGLAGAMRPQRVAAQSQPIPGSSLSWEYDAATRTLTITGTGKMPNFDDSSLPWKAFRYAPKVVIGAGVTSVGDLAFNSFWELTDLTLPDGLKTIGVNAFGGCVSLTNLTLPKSVTSIGLLAFSNCEALKEVTVFWDTPLDDISPAAFSGIDELDKVKLYVPAGKTGAYQAANVWGGFDVQEIPGGTLSTGLHWQYIPSSKTLSITGSGVMPDYDIFINQPWGAFRGQIETVTIGAGVTAIGKNAFASCEKLTAVTLPSSVTTIGVYAFSNCTALTGITIPSGVKTIKKSAFYGCTALTSVTLPEGLTTIEEGVFTDCDALASIELPASLQTIGVSALDAGGLTEIKVQTGNTHFEAAEGVLYNKGKTALLRYPRKKPGTTFTVPASVTTIGEYAFSECAALESITLLEGLQTIERNVFGECLALTHVTIPKSVTTIGKGAFTNCGKLASVTLPDDGKLQTIGEGAFTACFALSDLTIPKSVETIEEDAFYQCVSLTHVTLPADAQLTTIGKNAFYQCRSLTNLTIPKKVGTIGDNAFLDCAALASISIPNSVTAIADGVFAGCKALTTVTLPAGLQTIGQNAFQDCAALASISIPKSVTTIGSEAFSKCSALKDVTVAWETPIQPNSDAFKQLPLDKIRLHVPAGKIGAYKAANVWEDFIVMSDRGDLAGGLKWQMDDTYTLTITNPTPGSPKPIPDVNGPGEQPWESFRSEIQAVTIEDGVSSVGKNAFIGCAEMKSVTLPKSVTTIREGAFAGCDKLTSVTLPADGRLDTIGKEAFRDCSALTSISLPKSATTIEDRAFSGCEALTSVTLPADGKLQTIGVNAFGGCVKLKSVTLPHSVTKIEGDAFNSCKGLTSVTLPDNAQFTKIENGVFQYCKALERITIPSHVTTIEANAFYGCTALASATLPKSVTTIGWRAFQDCKALKDMTVAWTDTASIPNISPYVFLYTPPATVKLSDIRLHVPHGTVAAYQSKDVWKEFTIVEQPLPPTPTPEIPETPSTPSTPPVTGKKIGGITLSPSSFVLDGERTFRFTATISPSDAADKRLICTSSDETIVRVRALSAEETRRGLRSASDPAVIGYEGTVYGVGRATITVKSTDGSGLVVTCPVDVRRLPTSTVDATPTRLFATDGQLHLTLPASETVRIYNVSGALVRTFLAPAGDSSTSLPEGIYVVRVGDHTEKVVVK